MNGPSTPGPPEGPGTIGAILHRVWVILRGQLKLFLLLAIAPAGVVVLTYGLVFGALFAAGVLPMRPGQIPDPGRMVAIIVPVMMAATVPMLGAYALLNAAASHAAMRANRGATSNVREAYKVAWKRAGRYVWLTVLQWLVIAGPAMTLWGAVMAVFLMNARVRSNPPPEMAFLLIPLVMLGYFLMLIYFVWMALRICLAMPASMVENLPATASLKRSFQLTRGGSGRIFVVCLVVYAIQYGIVMAVEMAAFAVGGIGVFAGVLLHLGLILGVSLGVLWGALFLCAVLLLSALAWVSYQIAFCVIYDDQRGRLAWAAQAQGEPA